MGKDVKPSEMHPNDLPDERVFQDEFTREFIQSVEETRPGYYPFLSKTEKYKMDFPSGGKIGDRQYSLEENYFEGLVVGVINNDGLEMSFTLFYFGDANYSNIKRDLDAFQTRVGEKLDYKKMENNDRIIYYSNFKDNNFDNHVAYIQNKNNTGAIELILFIDCHTGSGCTKENNTIQNDLVDWIETIKFIDDEKEGLEKEI